MGWDKKVPPHFKIAQWFAISGTQVEFITSHQSRGPAGAQIICSTGSWIVDACKQKKYARLSNKNKPFKVEGDGASLLNILEHITD
jgi:hypothetical protein